MKIFIDKIDTLMVKPIGYTNLNSYPVHFKCATFAALARFVPAGENPEAYLNYEIDVEIAHECIKGLCESNNRHPQVIPLAEEFSYHVRGEVQAINYHVEPAGSRTTYVVAGDAAFALTLAETGSLSLSKGEMVEFDAHGLSLWDESI
ncbi:hypothetical protein ABHF33_16090 [Chitinibacter sp. FCG-7]|uniref:Uncharacterized protein n=1 Tax=Chitinibacter mangrovi TaxID=3153927 RepID=A0AAU7FA09_9NEIS